VSSCLHKVACERSYQVGFALCSSHQRISRHKGHSFLPILKSPAQTPQYLCSALQIHLCGTEMNVLVLFQKNGQATSSEVRLARVTKLRINEMKLRNGVFFVDCCLAVCSSILIVHSLCIISKYCGPYYEAGNALRDCFACESRTCLVRPLNQPFSPTSRSHPQMYRLAQAQRI